MKIVTSSDLKYYVESSRDSHFFSRKSMSFSGDTMRNYGVRAVKLKTNYDAEGNYTSAEGIIIDAWELYRRKPVKHGLKDSAFFRADTFDRTFGEVQQ